MAICPVCFNELGTWSDDPILATPSLSEEAYIGFTIIRPTHIIELQNDRNLAETQLGLPLTIWTPVTNIGFYQTLKTHIKELRVSTEAIISDQGLTKYDYFNYDAEGNYMGTTQTDWHNTDLDSEIIQVKASHIEDLRHACLRVFTEVTLRIHCHNPEGKEIGTLPEHSASAIYINTHYDGDPPNLVHWLCYGGDATHHPRIVTTEKRPQTIRALYNSMYQYYHINGIHPTENIIFSWSRTSYPLINIISAFGGEDEHSFNLDLPEEEASTDIRHFEGRNFHFTFSWQNMRSFNATVYSSYSLSGCSIWCEVSNLRKHITSSNSWLSISVPSNNHILSSVPDIPGGWFGQIPSSIPGFRTPISLGGFDYISPSPGHVIRFADGDYYSFIHVYAQGMGGEGPYYAYSLFGEPVDEFTIDYTPKSDSFNLTPYMSNVPYDLDGTAV